MIECSNCGHDEYSGAIFCSECGAQLIYSNTVDTTSFINFEQIEIIDEKSINIPNEKQNKTDNDRSYIIKIIESNEIIQLEENKEYTLGRVADGQPILPDIDLTVNKAYSYGVSRIHATIKYSGDKIVIVDLESSNGTRVNGQKILPQIEYPINRGDLVALGKLLLKIY